MKENGIIIHGEPDKHGTDVGKGEGQNLRGQNATISQLNLDCSFNYFRKPYSLWHSINKWLQ